MAIHQEWKYLPPPRLPLTLEEMVADYYWRRVHPRSQIKRDRDDIPEYCAEARNITIAIKRAVRSRRPGGTIHNHQSRVTKALPSYEAALFGVRRELETVDSFHQLWWTCERVQRLTPGIGPTTAYDVATRIAAYRDLWPERLYFHAGVLEGLKALGVYVRWDHWFVDVFNLPYPLNHMSMYDVEDFVCAYRNELYPGLVRWEPDPKASWFFNSFTPIWHRPDECWLPIRRLRRLEFQRKFERIAYRVWFNGKAPRVVEHRCGVLLCVNPRHLPSELKRGTL